MRIATGEREPRLLTGSVDFTFQTTYILSELCYRIQTFLAFLLLPSTPFVFLLSSLYLRLSSVDAIFSQVTLVALFIHLSRACIRSNEQNRIPLSIEVSIDRCGTVV